MSAFNHILEQVDLKWRAEFRRFVTTGEASEEFLCYLDKTPECQRAVTEVLSMLFSPFSDAIQKEQNG